MIKYRIIKSINHLTGGDKGYSVIFANGKAKGKKIMIGMGEPNWFPTMKDARAYQKECEKGD
jgi:hypothetical protein